MEKWVCPEGQKERARFRGSEQGKFLMGRTDFVRGGRMKDRKERGKFGGVQHKKSIKRGIRDRNWKFKLISIGKYVGKGRRKKVNHPIIISHLRKTGKGVCTILPKKKEETIALKKSTGGKTGSSREETLQFVFS